MQILVKDHPAVEIQEGASARDLAQKLHKTEPGQALAAVINGVTRDLDTELHSGDHVEFLDFQDSRGKEVFWHSSAHILAQAVLRLYPNAKPTIGPPIEQGFYYDFADLPIGEEDLPRIQEEMEKIVGENAKPHREVIENKEIAKQIFGNNGYKVELIEGFPEDAPLSAYRQGEFFDLCRGPHLPSLGRVRGIKLLKVAGAYWRGDSSREMLTRIYGITFPDKKELRDYLHRLEEAKKRDHKVLGPKLDLFSLKEEAPGMPFIHPRGVRIWNTLLDFWRRLHDRGGYVEIKTPTIMTRELWETSGHWEHYKHNMFCTTVEERDFAIKPMNCPGCILFYKSRPHSYRELPLRIAEIGHVFRFEASGALNGLVRVRSFHQDDAHLFMRQTDIAGEILEVLELVKKVYEPFGLEYRFELSTRPESGTIGTDEDWQIATEGLRAALEATGVPYRVNEGDGAFYGPKIDVHVRDALSRSWQTATIQLDMALPERFGLEYIDADGQKKRPVMVHRALFGSIERFFGILLEHFAGRFPLWISPLAVRFLAVADRHVERCQQLQTMFRDLDFACDVDSTNESMGKKVREAQLQQVNYIITIGDQELESGTVSVRTREGVQRHQMPLTEFIGLLEAERSSKALKSLLQPEIAASQTQSPSA
jgi:threonyl-tRNA synthetase